MSKDTISVSLDKLWADGSVLKAAEKSTTVPALADKLGFSSEHALRRAWKRLGGKKTLPRLGDMVNPAAGSTSKIPSQPSIEEDLKDRQHKNQVESLRRKVSDLIKELEKANLQNGILSAAEAAREFVTPIRPRERNSKLREATAVAMASDWHIEELVEPESVNNLNEYNLKIARRRVERFFEGVNYLLNYHADHFQIRDMVLWLGGDLITGHLREENLETNELSPVQAIATLHEWINVGIQDILAKSKLESLRVVCNSGNHGRLTDKVRPSTREANSIEWLLYHMLAHDFKNNKRVSFKLPVGQFSYVQIYNTLIRFLHGDNVNYGGGVGGITIPLNRAIAGWDTAKKADITALGHFHTYTDLPHMVVNGSLLGYSPYSMGKGFRFEHPRQAFFLIDSRRGKCFPSEVWVDDRP